MNPNYTPMPPDNQTPISVPEPPAPVYSVDKPTHKLRNVCLLLLALVLVSGAAFGGYKYGNTHQVQSAGTAPTVTALNQDSAEGGVHFVRSDGFPIDLKNKFSFSVGIPADMQAVNLSSTQRDGSAAEYLGTAFNDEFGRWVLASPENPTPSSSELSIAGIESNWLKGGVPLAGQPNEDNDNFYENAAENLSFLRNHQIQTPAQRKQYVADMASETASCAKDSTKGFVTANNLFTVCYHVSGGRDGYTPILFMEGYAIKNNQPLILASTVYLYDTSVNPNDADATRQATVDVNAGKYTKPVKQQITSMIEAVKQTKLTVTSNSN